MEIVLVIFVILGALLLAQSVKSLSDGFRFLRFVRRRRLQRIGDYSPAAAVIIPVKGVHGALETNIAAFLAQDYPRYQTILVVDDEKDPAFEKLRALIEQHAPGPGPRSGEIVVAGPCDANGQKVHNLLRGLDEVKPETEVLVFADADAWPSPTWLRSLVAPLADREATVSTGFRWYLPGESFVSQLRAAWDTSIATLMGEHDSSFPWGGSMAIRVEDFKRLRVRERYWVSTVSDDYCLGRAVRESGGRIRFEPRCLVASREDSSFAEFLHWTNRQIIITRVYAAGLWRLGLAAHTLYSATFVCGFLILVNPAGRAFERILAAFFLAVILALGMAKGRIRTIVAGEIFPEERGMLAKYGNRYWQLAPLVPWVMLCNFWVAAFTRTIDWGGVRYRLRSRDAAEVVSRHSA